jgi:hypothetical protein
LDFVSDDFCVVEAESRRIFSLYASAKLLPDRLEELPEFVVTNPDALEYEKAISFADSQSTFSIVRELELKGLVLLAGKGRIRPNLVPISPMEFMLGAVPSTVLLFGGTDRSHLMGLGSLSKQVPCFRMELSQELELNPGALVALIEKLQSEAD